MKQLNLESLDLISGGKANSFQPSSDDFVIVEHTRMRAYSEIELAPWVYTTLIGAALAAGTFVGAPRGAVIGFVAGVLLLGGLPREKDTF